MLKMLKTIGFIFLLLSFAGIALARHSVTRNITANIYSQDELSVSISKVNSSNNHWTPNQTSIAFGTLKFDTKNHIFLPDCYYAVDVGVKSNATNWIVTHTHSSMVNRRMPSANLDHNVIVTFVKTVNKKGGGTTDRLLRKVSFANSNRAYTKSTLNGGWLRIYYGIATGDPAAHESYYGVGPITADKPAGYYVGSVTITLTP